MFQIHNIQRIFRQKKLLFIKEIFYTKKMITVMLRFKWVIKNSNK